jgi:dTDP-4-amino-4,6-dideoxygalactose transaminase
LKSKKNQVNLEVAQKLAALGIESRPVFWPLGRMKAFSKFQTVSDEVSNSIAHRAISLPSGPHVSAANAHEIASLINSVI